MGEAQPEASLSRAKHSTTEPLRSHFLKVVMLQIKLEGNGATSTMQAHILSLHTPLTPRVKGQNIIFSKSCSVVYQIKGNGA